MLAHSTQKTPQRVFSCVGRIDWTDFVLLRRPCAHRLCRPAHSRVPFVCGQTSFSLVRVLCYRIQHKKHPEGCFLVLVGLTGLEPATSSSRTKRSTRLNYNPKFDSLLQQKFFYATIIFNYFAKM